MRDVYLMAGQSNMSGRGALFQLPVFPNANRVFNYSRKDNGTWINPAVEPMDFAGSPVDEGFSCLVDTDAAASPQLAFANAMADYFPDREIGIVSCAKGGSPSKAWRRDWSCLSPYGAMLFRARRVLQDGYAIKGLCFYQGETDAQSQTQADEWSYNFTSLVTGIRMDLGIPDLPIVYVKIGNNPNSGSYPAWSSVQSRQATSFQVANNVKMVDAGGLTVQNDKLHLVTASCVTIGTQMADAMATMVA